MALSRHALSHLIHAELLSIDDVVFWDKIRPPEIEPRDDDVPYLVQKGERLDNLAFLELGDPHLGWVIMIRNNLGLWPSDLVDDEVIFIPSLEGLKARGVI